jgi:uncharacterized protein YkwD
MGLGRACRGLVVCVGGVVTLSVQAAPPAGEALRGTCGLSAFAEEALQHINRFRASPRRCGAQGAFAAAPPLVWNARLAEAAGAHSSDMASRHYFSHDSRDGRGVQDRVEAAGYRWRALGENIAAGPETLVAVVTGWQRSDSHCANLMNPVFAEAGLACVAAAQGDRYGRYWTLDLGAPRGRPQP